MTPYAPVPVGQFVSCVDCQPTVARLIGNIRGFVYRRKHDARWTMDYVSEGCRDVTGYDPHRFIENQSLSFADLIARSEWRRITDQVHTAATQRRSIALEYPIRTAHGWWVVVEDRLTPVTTATGAVMAIEGVIARACSEYRSMPPTNRGTAGPDPHEIHHALQRPH